MINNDVRQVIIVSTAAKMPKGKLAAQVAHASMGALLNDGMLTEHMLSLPLSTYAHEWLNGSFTKVCVRCDSEEEMLDIYKRVLDDGYPCAKIIDNGRTVFNGVPTLTTIGIGPLPKEIIDQYTGHLKLL